MEKLDKIFIWLSMCELEFSTLYEILEAYENLEDLWATEKYEGEITEILSGAEFHELMVARVNGTLDKVINGLENNSKIKYVCMHQEGYPKKLQDLEYPPLVIYYVGDLSLIDGRNVAIIGSRVCTRYGRDQTERFTRELCNSGFTIVSGLSEGIDTVAHETALKHNGKTIGVVANGLNSIYPSINTNLARDIVKSGGLIMTEFHPDYEPNGVAFLRRNRLVAGISEGVLATEARRESGSLHTINFAIDLSKEIFALPGNCNSAASAGTNDIIKSFSAICVTEPSEVINKLNADLIYREIINQNQRPVSRAERTVNLKDEEAQILEILENEDTHFDDIAKILDFNTKKLLGLLTMMEIRGLIKKLPGNFYVRKE